MDLAAANRRKAQAPRRLMPQAAGDQQRCLHRLLQLKSNGNFAPVEKATEEMQRQSNSSSKDSHSSSSSSSSSSHMSVSLQEYLRLAVAQQTSAPLDLTKAASLTSGGSAAPLPGQLGPPLLPFPMRPQSSSSLSPPPAPLSSASRNGSGGPPRTLGQCAEAALEEAAGLACVVSRVLRGLQQPPLAEVQKARGLVDGAQQQLVGVQQALTEYERLLQTLQVAQQHQMQEMAAAAAAAVAAAASAVSAGQHQPPLPLASLSNHGRHRLLTSGHQHQNQLHQQQDSAMLAGSAASKKPRKDPRCQDGPEKDWVDPSFVPAVSADGKFVILSDTHPAVRMSSADYQESISRASGSATRHLRILMKHFFSQGTLARSSLTGNGQYKEVLDENLTMGIRDYIQHRYPKLKAAKINLCCTDVCVQARRVIEKQARSASAHGRPTSPSSATAAAITVIRDTSAMDDADEVDDGEEAGSLASSHDLTPDLNPASISIHRLHPIDSPMD